MTDDSNSKKDLTGIIPLPPDPTSPDGGASELPPLPSVEDFGSLADFIQSEPAPTESPAMTEPPALEGFELLPPMDANPLESSPGETDPVEAAPFEFTPSDANATEPSSMDSALPELPAFEMPPPEVTPPPASALPPTPPQTVAQNLRSFSERTPVGAPAVAPGYPFTLEIEGKLRHFEAGRLLDLLNQRQYGIRPVDLEPQLQAGRIRIPQISEYAAILIIQALKDAPVRMHLRSAVDEDTVIAPSPAQDQLLILGDALRSGIEKIQVFPGDSALTSSGQIAQAQALDTVSASHEMTSSSTDPEHSRELDETLEILKRELRTRAEHLGATAVVQFRYQIHPLHDGLKYRVVASGLAVQTPPAL